jgi:hypothetical protein
VGIKVMGLVTEASWWIGMSGNERGDVAVMHAGRNVQRSAKVVEWIICKQTQATVIIGYVVFCSDALLD